MLKFVAVILFPSLALAAASSQDLESMRSRLPLGSYQGTSTLPNQPSNHCTVTVTGAESEYAVLVDPPWNPAGGARADFRVKVGDPLMCHEGENGSVCQVNQMQSGTFMTFTLSTKSHLRQVSVEFSTLSSHAAAKCDLPAAVSDE